ncbi:hypothetical protein NL676_030830 [Syzygium grande]|nr:hypothetical protein NL676_030830 [Syzygium grande]
MTSKRGQGAGRYGAGEEQISGVARRQAWKGAAHPRRRDRGSPPSSDHVASDAMLSSESMVLEPGRSQLINELKSADQSSRELDPLIAERLDPLTPVAMQTK